MTTSPRQFDILPRVPGTVTFGGTGQRNVVLAARVSEKGNSENIYFDGSENFVVLQVGKRGSGKSYGLGSILEAFATTTNDGVGKHSDARAVVLLDPLDIHWPALIPLTESGPEGLRRQYALLKQWAGLKIEPINVQVFFPAGFRWPIDRPGCREYKMPVAEMTAGDWSLLLDTDLFTEPRGRLLDESFRKVTDMGWEDPSGTRIPGKRDYSVQDLIDCMLGDRDINAFYGPETIRSVLQVLRSYASMPLFSESAGTPVADVARPRTLSVLCLGRLPDDLRSVVATMFVRRLKADRMYASQIARRLALSPETDATRAQLEKEARSHVPRTILAIDEAQILLPARAETMTRQALDSFVLEGRNYGLSLWLATQRPKGAISERAMSQIDTFIIHRLSISEDIRAVCGMLQNKGPEKIRLAGQSAELEIGDLIRSLEVGQAVFSSSTSTAQRLVVGTIRPRMVAHGGEAF